MTKLALALLLVSGTALADTPATDKKLQLAAAKDPSRIICKTWAPAGSLIPNYKECRTKHDWDMMRLNTSSPTMGGSCNSAETGKCEN